MRYTETDLEYNVWYKANVQMDEETISDVFFKAEKIREGCLDVEVRGEVNDTWHVLCTAEQLLDGVHELTKISAP